MGNTPKKPSDIKSDVPIKYQLVCRRCGRLFLSEHSNEMFCSEPDMSDEFHRNCKQIRRQESKLRTKEKKEKFERDVMEGKILVTAKYGCLSRSEYNQKFENYIREKHGLDPLNYAAFQSWYASHQETVGEDYAEFQEYVGLDLRYRYK